MKLFIQRVLGTILLFLGLGSGLDAVNKELANEVEQVDGAARSGSGNSDGIGGYGK